MIKIIIIAGLLWGHAVLCASEDSIQCANLIYGGTQTSVCFSDEFLSSIQTQTAIPMERRFKSVKLDSEELFHHPFVVMTGQADFNFTMNERENLKEYLSNGGFLLGSAGCSSKDFDQAFRRNIKALLGSESLHKIKIDHPVFKTVNVIEKLPLKKSSGFAELEGIEYNGKLVAIYSSEGLNDTANSEGCCCCGGNEIKNAIQMNVNILMYALLY